MSATFVERAPAKLNLALHVRRRRPDGYHELDTLFAFVRDGDLLAAAPAAANSFVVAGQFAAALEGHDNLVLRARDRFAERIAPLPPLAILLDKQLPVASGIGGGSADAAAMLRLAARLIGAPFDDPRLLELAADLGADVPVCLSGRAAFATARGDALEPATLASDMPVLLVNPGVAVSTGAAFALWDGVDRGPLGRDAPLAGRNDLEAPARAIAPVIGEVLDALRRCAGATLVQMSGSGATCFALFDHEADRVAAAEAIRARQPGWWCLETALA